MIRFFRSRKHSKFISSSLTFFRSIMMVIMTKLLIFPRSYTFLLLVYTQAGTRTRSAGGGIMEPLPLDILLHIIDLLAGGDDEDIKSLRILSLACKSMVPLCRKPLFSYIRNLASLPVSVLKRFNDLLSKKPDIARYVKRLDYRCFTHTPTFDEELNILDILKKRSSLQRIRLSSSGSNWNNFPESLRSSLVSLIQLPTVVHLDIEDFNEFPATALSGCSNLTNLWLGSIEFSPPEVNQIISRSKIPTLVSLYIRGPGEFSSYDFAAFLNSAALHAGGPIVDFSRLQRAEFDVDSRDDICHVIKLIEATTRLEYFRIDSLIGGENWRCLIPQTFDR